MERTKKEIIKKNFKVLLFFPNEPLLGVVPPNMALLSACLKEDGFDVKLFDCTIYKAKNKVTNEDLREKFGQVLKTEIDDYISPKTEDIYEDFVKTVEEYKPDLIGFNVIDSTIDFVLSFMEKIKYKNIPTVVGGVGATFNYKRLLSGWLVDFVCIGEGEEAIVELCNELIKGGSCNNIKNIYTRNLYSGDIIKNPLRPLVDLNTLPIPDFTIFEDWRFYRPFRGKVIRSISIDTDRGCPYVCTYCAAPILRGLYKKEGHQKYFRLKNIDKIFEEAKILIKKHNINFIAFQSESFLGYPLNEFRKFAERYIAEINLPFTCQSRLDSFTEEKTKLLAEMGCKNVSVGLEHGSEEIRQNILNKKLTNKTIIDAIKRLDRYGIEPTINNMIGLPDETREQVFETIELNREINSMLTRKHGLNNFIFMPFGGTALRELCLEKGYIKEADKMPFGLIQGSILDMPSMTKEEILGLEKTLALYIKLPKSYWPDIKIAESNTEKGNQMFEKLLKLM
jgi:anaerobic magnesium-protoporphyrin IX monomethyl ester cyclase